MKHLWIATVAIAASVGCKSKSDDNKQASAATATQPTKAKAEVSKRRSLTPFRALLDEVSRAELDAGGVLIDLGTPDQHKYTRGGWRTGWGEAGSDAHSSWASMTSRRGFFDLIAPRTAPTAIVFRARSRANNQRLTWFVEGKELGTVDVPAEWTTLRVPIKGEFPREGRIRLEARASAAAVEGVRAEIDWVWLATGEGEPMLGPRVLPLDIAGTTRRTLAAPSARTYTFYLQPPAASQLVVDLGATERAEFAVTVVTDDGKRTELLRETVEKSWVEHAIALDGVVGRAVRLELTTLNQTGAVGWGEPEIMLTTAPPAPPPAGAPPKNVILLVMDTARADAFGPFAGPDRIVKTPVFDALAAKSTVFVSAYDNENWTKPSVATTLSGLYPMTHDAKTDASKLSKDVELITERLEREGFATAGFVANGYVSNAFGFEQGWGTFKNYIRENKPSEAEYVFRDALAWHEQHTKENPNQPFFLYLQTIDPHVVYRVDREYWAPYFDGEYDGPLGKTIEAEDQVKLSTGKLVATERDKAWLRALYYGEISYHDAQLGKFLEELEKRKVLDDTLLVITNDHGEELGERGRYGHGHQVYEEMIRAPLIIHYPPIFQPGAVVSDIVEHVDLSPTILDVLGKEPMKDADGISFLPLVRGQPTSQPHYAVIEFLQSRRVLRVGTWKLFAKPEGGGALFDLAADPKEERELDKGAAPIARQLCEVHLGEALATPDKAKRMFSMASRRQFRAGEAQISPQVRRQLEALGYFGGGPNPADAPDDKQDDTKSGQHDDDT